MAWAAIARMAMSLKSAGKAAGAATSALSEYGKKANEIKDVILGAANLIGGKWIEMQDIAFQTGRSMAMSREMAMRYDRQLMQSTKELARQYGITAKEIADFQKTYAEATGRNVMLTKEQTKSMAALAKITDSATAASLIDEFDKVGVGITRATANVGLLQERAKALGISPAKATKMMADNIKLAASYSFKNGLADIEKMSLKSAEMRMDMNAVMSASERFANIESAITTSANIQMLGGSFAREFSNPMGAMYESMADPKAFQDRLLRTVQGKGRYDEKTGQVTFDPVTMMQMREMAKQLGMSVDQLTNPAMAEIQNNKVVEELRAAGTLGKWSPEQLEAIKNLSRTNVDLETGKHQVTYTDVNGELITRDIESLTEEELRIAQDRQMSEDGLFSDVQDIKDILERTLGRARGTTSTKENITGLGEELDSFMAQFQNLYMGTVSGGLNGANFGPWDWLKKLSWPTGQIDVGTHATEGIWKNMFSWTGPYAFEQGGIVEPIPHAEMGTIIPGDSYHGDKTPVMANSGEMILNKGEQKGLFDLLKNVALTGAMIWGGNKLGNRFGMRGLGANAALGSLLSGGGLGAGSLLGSGAAMLMGNRMMGGMMPMGMRMRMSPIQRLMGSQGLTLMNPTVMMNGQTIMNGNIGDGSIVDQIEDMADAADTARIATRSFSARLRDLSRQDTFLGRGARGLRNFKAARLRMGRRISSSRIGHAYRNRIADANMLKARTLDWYDNSRIGKFNRHLVKDTKSLFGRGASTAVAKTAAQEASTVTKAVGSVGKASKFLGGAGKMLGSVGRLAGPIGTVLAVGSAIGDISAASSQYDARVREIENSGASDMEKARAKDAASKEKNANIGSGVGSAAGAALGGALGMTLGPLGAMAGAWLGSKAGGLIGKGIGSLFGGGEEKKLKKEQKEKEEKEKEKNAKEKYKYLDSIDKNVAKIVGGHSIGAKPLKSRSIGIGTVIGGMLGPAGAIIGNMMDNGVNPLPISGNFMKVNPSKEEKNNAVSPVYTPKSIKLDVSGTIKLEGGGKSVDFDIDKLLKSPEFKDKLTNIILERTNQLSNAGKTNMESQRNNMASQYNKSGK